MQRRQRLEDYFIHRFRFVEAARAEAIWIDEKLRCFEQRTGHVAALDSVDVQVLVGLELELWRFKVDQRWTSGEVPPIHGGCC